ncbi:chemotaxis protein CheW [Leptolyngbya sp. FACHB-711]|uniref:chemotaxis protein CheW n=1 Tax=unclassified Leptolyngbya TaxID=2650499 RepID=UPI0016842335|nr:chemotaxis protein CheW [Leptolyngbya sp. FACHB-711]MBD1849033.1 chemotaxis protein CheW [Cyanobacteria bacterium FACHB-502]MBD2027892.1 chemotaxis protein CheW [Leptolyngbya sp. FACHB-711]
MQQLHQRNLGLPPDQIRQKQAQQGDIQAIAVLLNQKLNSRGIQVQGNRRENRVGILLESTTPLPHQPLLTWVHQELSTLNPKGIAQIEVYGRIKGQHQTEWQAVINLKRSIATPGSDIASLDAVALGTVSLAEWLQQGVISDRLKLQSANPPLSTESVVLTPFLRFYFAAEETALLPLEGVKEILKVPPSAILPVPQMPAGVLGVYNCRGNILWLVDLGIQVGLENSSSSRSKSSSKRLSSASSSSGQQVPGFPIGWTAGQGLTVIVIEVEHQTLGLVVSEVLEIEPYPLQQIQPALADLFSPQLQPFIQGYLSSSSSPVLSLKALINDPRLQIYQ